MTVRDLAESCGLLSMYVEMYSLQSVDVHASDGFAYLEQEELDGKDVLSSMVGTTGHRVESLATHMQMAFGIFLVLLSDIGKAFDLDLVALQRIRDDYQDFIRRT